MLTKTESKKGLLKQLLAGGLLATCLTTCFLMIPKYNDEQSALRWCASYHESIRAKHSGKYVSLSKGSHYLFQYSLGNVWDDNAQHFEFCPSADDTWEIRTSPLAPFPKWDSHLRNLVNGPVFCLDVANAATNGGAAVIAYECHGGDNQKWYIEDADTGVRKTPYDLGHSTTLNVVLKPKHAPRTCMAVFGGTHDEGENILEWQCSGTDNQRFTLSQEW